MISYLNVYTEMCSDNFVTKKQDNVHGKYKYILCDISKYLCDKIEVKILKLRKSNWHDAGP